MIKIVLLLVLSFPLLAESPAYRPNIQFAKGINPNDINRLDPRLLKVVDYIAEYCENNQVIFVVTSMIRSPERNKKVKSVSNSHVEARALDFSIREKWGWNEAKLIVLTENVEMLYNFIGAYSYLGRRRTIMILHSAGDGIRHAHIQVDRNKSKIKVK